MRGPSPGAPPFPLTPRRPRGAPHLGSPAAPRPPTPPPAAGRGLRLTGVLMWRAGGGIHASSPSPGRSPQTWQLSPGAHAPPQKLPGRKRKWGRRRTMALLRGGEAGAGASALGPRRGGAGGGGRRRRGRARGGGRERTREGARRARPPSPQDPPLGPPPPAPLAARASGRWAPRPRLPQLHPRPGPLKGRPGERRRRRVVGPGSGSRLTERIHLPRGARALTHTRTQTAGDTRGPGLLGSNTVTTYTDAHRPAHWVPAACYRHT